MRIPRLYVDQKLAEKSVLILEPQASHYLCNVLRVKAGRELVLFNGYLSDTGSRGEHLATFPESNTHAAFVAFKHSTTTQSAAT